MNSSPSNESPPHEDTAAALRTLKRTGIVLGALALVIVSWSALSSRFAGRKLKEQAEAQAVISVATVKPTPISAGSVLTLPGNVQANTDAPIYARTGGYLRRWLVDIGAPVKAGQILAQIDAPELDQQLRAAEADVATASANQKIAEVTAERWRGLRDSQAVSRQAVDEKLSLADASAAQLRAAEANLQRLRELSRFKNIVAPFDGVVTVRNAEVGQLIVAGGGTGPELFRITDMRKLRLYVRVPQAYANAMQPSLSAEVRFPDRPGKVFNARLERTSNALDAASRTLLAQLLVDNEQQELLSGSYAEVRFNLPVGQNVAFKLPANVLLAAANGLQVATVDAAGKVTLRPVSLGRDYGGEVEIVEGLNADDNVILSPPDSLTPNSVVRVTKPADNTAALQ